MSGAPTIIEVRVNETAYRTGNPNLPYSPEEIIDQAVRAWEAGASILHWHGRDAATGDPDNATELYRAVIAGLRERTDLILHPTLGYITQQDPVERTRHVMAVNDDPVLKVDMAPVDFGALNVDYWDPEARTFTTWDRIYANSRQRLRDVLGILRDGDVYISAVCWDTGQIRTARAFQEMGLLPRRTLWELTFTGEVMPVGTPPTLPALQAMLAEIPDGDPWTVLTWNGNVLPVAAWALTMGGHVSLGLGDWHYDHLGYLDHGQLVGRITHMAETLDRPIATPAQAREMLRMAPRPGLPTRA